MRILLPHEPKSVRAGVDLQSDWDSKSRTLLLKFENRPDGVRVEIEW